MITGTIRITNISHLCKNKLYNQNIPSFLPILITIWKKVILQKLSAHHFPLFILYPH